jgi:electron transport complex protein RnfG
MREMLRLFVVVTLFGAISGGILAGVRAGTQERIEYQQIKFVKGPAILQTEAVHRDPRRPGSR